MQKVRQSNREKAQPSKTRFKTLVQEMLGEPRERDITHKGEKREGVHNVGYTYGIP